MLPIHVTLSYYKRPEIRQAMAAQCRGKEVAVKFGDRFGRRPDIVVYDSDILSFAQKKATSFHISEETWSNPMQLSTTLRRQDLDELRVGWDLVLDVDFPIWEATRMISHSLIEQLRQEGVPDEAITAKFSGNKGFHIAVPFEAFPDTYVDADGEEVLMSDLFPEGVKTIVEYLVYKVDGPENNYALSEQLVSELGLERLSDVLVVVDASSGKVLPGARVDGYEFVCPSCSHRERSDKDFIACAKCGALIRPVHQASDVVEKRRKVDLAVDTMLVSSRHMYRLVYSLHEKSGLASVPVPLDGVRSFDKSKAHPDTIDTLLPFLRRDVERGCAHALLHNAMRFKPAEEKKSFAEIEWVGDAAPEEFFPPPIVNLLGELRDGRKRALFVLTNFLRSVGWSYEMIEARLREWNDAQPDPLRETEIEGHLRYHKQKGQVVLPPNFDNDMYYKDLGVLAHDELSSRVKNPVQYVRLRIKQQGKR